MVWADARRREDEAPLDERMSGGDSVAAKIAHRRRMGMIPSAEMPATRKDADCGCGGSSEATYHSYRARGTKDPNHGHLKVKR